MVFNSSVQIISFSLFSWLICSQCGFMCGLAKSCHLGWPESKLKFYVHI